MSLKLAARLVTVEPYKIADIQENDTTIHTIDISSIVPLECMAILVRGVRMSGAGVLFGYAVSGPTTITIGGTDANMAPSILTIKDQEIRWRNTTANDDWDVYLFGYFVQKRTR